ncbi:MAG: hypothetical protein Q9201_001758 [Fulgogasparrea decipioides]
MAKAKAKASHTPRRKRTQRIRSPTSGRFKSSRVTKAIKSSSIKKTSRAISENEKRVRARTRRLIQLKDLKRDEGPEDSAIKDLQTPSTPQLGQLRKRDSSIWNLITGDRSFWDIVKASATNQNPFTNRSFADDDVEVIINRLNNSINNQIQSYKVENHGYMSSSSPATDDPREIEPLTIGETEDLQRAIWPTVQHVVELTGCRVRLPDEDKDYLTQLRGVRDQLTVAWQVLGRPGNAPSLFQLEAWTGGIRNWHSSFYTNGEQRFAASVVEAQIEAWRSEMPSLQDTSIADQLPDNEEVPPIASPFVESTPSQPGHRRALFATYDQHCDNGFLPTAAQIQTYQYSTFTTLGNISMSDHGIGYPSDGSYFDEGIFQPRRRSRFRIHENITPPTGSDRPFLPGTREGSQESDKENGERTADAFSATERRRLGEELRELEVMEDGTVERWAGELREESPTEMRRSRVQMQLTQREEGLDVQSSPRQRG